MKISQSDISTRGRKGPNHKEAQKYEIILTSEEQEKAGLTSSINPAVDNKKVPRVSLGTLASASESEQSKTNVNVLCYRSQNSTQKAFWN